MRMGIDGRWLPVCSPSCMGDTYRPRYVLVMTERIKVGNLAFCLIYIQTAVRIQQRNTGAVISPIFKPAQTFHQYGICISFTYIANNAAHKQTITLGL